jgi:beta-lactamase regulating signal transducer with metallopeptidase domain
VDLVLNWVGQGLIVALAVTALLAVARGAPTRARYGAAAAGLVAVLLLPLAALLPPWTGDMAGPAAPVPGDGSALVALPSQWWTSGRYLVALWGVWSAVAAVRTVLRLRALACARRACHAFPAEIEARLPQWQAIRTTGRRPRLVVSHGVRTAAVLGGKTPLIAVAPALVNTLSPGDLDRVVVHEWAHVQWHDDRALLLQAWIRVVAGWHPAVWWLDRLLHFEREVACDEHAVRLTGSAKGYANCLAALASLPPIGGRELPVAGASAGSDVRRRVIRVLAFGTTPGRSRFAAGCACVLPVAIAGAVADVRMVAASPPIAVVVRIASVPATIQPADHRDGGAAVARSASDEITPSVAARRGVSFKRNPAPRHEQAGGAVDMAVDAPPGSDVLGAAEPAEPPRPATASQPPVPIAISDWPLTGLRDSLAAVPITRADGRAISPPQTSTLWSAAATGGVAIGRGSQKAAVSTAGFFARVGKTVAGAF